MEHTVEVTSAPTHRDVEWLLLATAQGDDRAAAAFVAATRSTIERVCRVFGSGLDIDDLVSESYLRALRSAASFDGVSSPMAWLVTIARRVCVDEVRRVARRRRLWVALTAAPHVSSGATAELEQLIDSLAPERREAFLLTAVAGFSYDEAAELLGCPIGTIRSRVARARADLAGEFHAAEAM
jgi:RNA polymerase sigma-70 factor (ECF subfamily)